MPEIYRQVAHRAEAPRDGALIRMWRENGRALAAVETGEDVAPAVTDPDLALFAASLALARHDLCGLFVWLEDRTLWQDEWGTLTAY